MHKTFAINIRPEDKDSIPYLLKLTKLLRDKGIKILLPDYRILRESALSGFITDQKKIISEPDIALSIGGDGTLLHTVRLFSGKNYPILGINRGRLGFLTEFMPDEAIEYLNNIISGNYKVIERDMLELIHIRGYEELQRILLLNDAAISRGTYSRPITLNLDIDGKFLNSFSGDGLIIATPTGSTGYSLSAGGPIISPTVKDIILIMPICPHTLATRPLIIPGESRLEVTVGPVFNNTVMTVDGHDSIEIFGNDKIFFSETDNKAVFVAHPERNFYEILKQKLSWGRSHQPEMLT